MLTRAPFIWYIWFEKYSKNGKFKKKMEIDNFFYLSVDYYF